MQSEEIRKKFLEFFKERGHTIVPSSSLIPDDPSVLFTTAGMQQFKPYYISKADPLKDFDSKNTASIQKCIRTSDIEFVGDETHLTFFEMLGNFSFGGYFKKEAIHWGYEFIVNELGISPDRITVSVFNGWPSSGSPTYKYDPESKQVISGKVSSDNTAIPADKESFEIWHKEIGIPVDKIKKCGRKDNFWGPTGNEGPCGPTTEIYVDGVEVWNIVFNEWYQDPIGSLRNLKTPGVDTGMGFERLTAIMQGISDVFETDLFHPLITKIREAAPNITRESAIVRILADHLRAGIFAIADGVRPANKEVGYVLRRLLRRILVYGIKYDIHADLFPLAVDIISEKFGKWYPEVNNKKGILEVWLEEKSKFEKALGGGLKEIEKYKDITAKDAFYLYETFGLPVELLNELAPGKLDNFKKEDFEEEFKKHRKISRAGVEKKFGGHGLVINTGELKAANPAEEEKVVRLHTATHLLQAALQNMFGPTVHQMGSDITAERARFDFSFNRKLTEEEIIKIEEEINEVIRKDLPVYSKEMPKQEAKMAGALSFFKEKYPDIVKIYFIGPAGGANDKPYSVEFCGGPHVSNTGKIGKFRIAKQEAVGAGIRRIRINLS